MHPDWTGSPQHFIGGLVFAAALAYGLVRRTPARPWQAVVLAFGLTLGAEVLVELAEYPLQYADHYHATAYYDTLADLADTTAGAILGALLALPLGRPVD